jgi:hypothetical protein
MEERGAGHEPGQSLSLVISWFQDLLALRLGSEATGLKPVDPCSGLWVDLKTRNILKDAREADPKMTGWLPSLRVYEKWKALDNGLEKFT